MKKRYFIFLLPSFISIFSLFYLHIGLIFGFVSKNVGEGALLFIVIFYVLILLQAILLIPAYLLYRKEETDAKLRIKRLYVNTLLIAAFMIFMPRILALLSLPFGLILANFYSESTALSFSFIITIILVLSLFYLSFLKYKKIKNLLRQYSTVFFIVSIFLVFSAYTTVIFSIDEIKSEKKYEDVKISIIRNNINLILNGTGKSEWCDYIQYNNYVNSYISYENLCYTMATLKFQNESICTIGATGRSKPESLQQMELCKNLVRAAIANELKPTLCEEDKSTGSNKFRNPNEWKTCNYYVNLYFKGKLE